MQRRDFLKLLGAGTLAGSGLVGRSAFASAAPHVVIVGGGVGGATAAKYIKLADRNVRVTLIERNPIYIRPYGSSEVLTGHIGMSDLEVSYDALKNRYGIEVIIDTAVGLDPVKQEVATAGGSRIRYDRLIVSPGIQLHYDAIEGYSKEVAETRIPSGWIPGSQTQLLANQLKAMPQGGTFVIVAPGGPYRCPPGPYERAALVTEWMGRHNPTGKVLILDPKDGFVTDQTMILGWNRLYGFNVPAKFREGMPTEGEWPMRDYAEPSRLAWVPASDGGTVRRIDPVRMELEADNGLHRADVINVVPPMTAGKVAYQMGLTDEKGWCPIDRRTHESAIHPNVHVIGDACIADAMPKSGFSANNQGKVVARAVVDLLAGRPTEEPLWKNTCYALAGSEYGLYVADVFKLKDGKIARINGARYLPLDATRAQIRTGAVYQQAWMKTITDDSFA